MGLNLNDKKAVVAEVSAQVANAQTIVIAEYRGIEVTDLTVLRRKARESGVYLRVLKNTLVRRAVAGTEFAGSGLKEAVVNEQIQILRQQGVEDELRIRREEVFFPRAPFLLAFLLGNGQHLDDARVLGQGRLEVCVNDIDFVDFAIEELLRRQMGDFLGIDELRLIRKTGPFFIRRNTQVL